MESHVKYNSAGNLSFALENEDRSVSPPISETLISHLSENNWELSDLHQKVNISSNLTSSSRKCIQTGPNSVTCFYKPFNLPKLPKAFGTRTLIC